MNTQQPSSQADEMDLTDIFTLIRRAFYNVVALCFKALDFVFKFWWVIILLIVAGVALGLFTKGPNKYLSTLVIQTNFNTQPYVYNAIDQFNQNLKEDDIEFINMVGLNPQNPGLGKVEIEPVVDVVALMEEIEASERTLGTIINELSVEEETELFASERFYSTYKYHRLTIGVADESSKESIKALINYINDRPLLKELRTEITKNTKERIATNEKTISLIDDLVENYAMEAEITREDLKGLSYFNNQNNININGVFTLKNELVIETEQLKNDLIFQTDAVIVVSDIQTARTQSLKDRKEILYPVIFIFFFLLIAGIRYTYVTLRKEVERQQLLD